MKLATSLPGIVFSLPPFFRPLTRTGVALFHVAPVSFSACGSFRRVAGLSDVS